MLVHKYKILQEAQKDQVIEEMKTNFFMIKMVNTLYNGDYGKVASVFNKRHLPIIQESLQSIDAEMILYILTSPIKQFHIFNLMKDYDIINQYEHSRAIDSIDTKKIASVIQRAKPKKTNLSCDINISYNDLYTALLSLSKQNLAIILQNLCHDQQYYAELMSLFSVKEQAIVHALLEPETPSTELYDVIISNPTTQLITI